MEVSTKQMEISITVPQPDCDLNCHLTMGGILRQTQHAGMVQCDALGIDTDYMLSFGTGWMLAKVSVEVYGEIREEMPLRVVTRPAPGKRAVYKRVTSYYSEEGELLAQVDARWVLADLANRRLLRRLPEGMELPFTHDVETEHCVDIRRAEQLEDCGSVTAGYSRVDLNRHLNNTRYADVICDALPLSVWENGAYLRKLVIYYRNELPMGHTMAMQRGEVDYNGKKSWYITGMDGDTRCFEANALFE